MNQPVSDYDYACSVWNRATAHDRPSIFLMVQGLDRDPGVFLGNLFTIPPPLPILFLGVFTTYQAVVNTVRALSEKPIHYPLSIPFVK